MPPYVSALLPCTQKNQRPNSKISPNLMARSCWAQASSAILMWTSLWAPSASASGVGSLKTFKALLMPCRKIPNSPVQYWWQAVMIVTVVPTHMRSLTSLPDVRTYYQGLLKCRCQAYAPAVNPMTSHSVLKTLMQVFVWYVRNLTRIL